MRELQIIRERALACFAIPYYCFYDEDPAVLTGQMSAEDFHKLVEEKRGLPLKNGQAKSVTIDDQAHTLFAVAWREHSNLVTELSEIPAGTEDVTKTIITDFDGARRLELHLK